jgi:hypothetical protein
MTLPINPFRPKSPSTLLKVILRLARSYQISILTLTPPGVDLVMKQGWVLHGVATVMSDRPTNRAYVPSLVMTEAM